MISLLEKKTIEDRGYELDTIMLGVGMMTSFISLLFIRIVYQMRKKREKKILS